jgi:hypothetical protein
MCDLVASYFTRKSQHYMAIYQVKKRNKIPISERLSIDQVGKGKAIDQVRKLLPNSIS